MNLLRRLIILACLTVGWFAVIHLLVINIEPELTLWGARDASEWELRFGKILEPILWLLIAPVLPIAWLFEFSGPSITLFYLLAALFWGCVSYHIARRFRRRSY